MTLMTQNEKGKRLDGMYANLPFKQFPVFPSAIEIH